MKLLMPFTIAVCLALSKAAFATTENEADLFDIRDKTPSLRRNLQGGGYGHGHGHGDVQGGGQKQQAMRVIHNLFDHRDVIKRELHNDPEDVTIIVSATTTSTDPQVAAWIEKHLRQMKALKESGGRMRDWDPLFGALFDERDDMDLEVDFLGNGVHARVIAHTECAEALAQAHYKTVSAFVEEGYEEMDAEHDVPDECL